MGEILKLQGVQQPTVEALKNQEGSSFKQQSEEIIFGDNTIGAVVQESLGTFRDIVKGAFGDPSSKIAKIAMEGNISSTFYTVDEIVDAYNERNKKYGLETEDMPSDEYGDYCAAKRDNKGINIPSKELGVKKTQYGDYIETKVTLYNNMQFDQLSKEDQQKVLKYQKDLALWEKAQENPLKYGKQALLRGKPELDMEIATETRVESKKLDNGAFEKLFKKEN